MSPSEKSHLYWKLRHPNALLREADYHRTRTPRKVSTVLDELMTPLLASPSDGPARYEDTKASLFTAK